MDIALKQRLVGASVLIALAVIVLPMLLGGKPEGSAPDAQKIELPPQPQELDFETRRYPIGESGAPQPQNTPERAAKELPEPEPSPAPAPALDTRPVADAGSAAEPPADSSGQLPSVEIVPGKPPAVEPEPAPDPPGDRTDGRYIVQVASFGAAGNANRLSETLRGYGYAVATDTIKSDVGTLHRVRVGPYANEAAASEVVTRLQSQVDGIKPRIMDLQPEKAAAMTAPSDPLVRWVVQVGSFASTANADNLVARLRLESMSAYKEEVRNSSGSTIYRVRVGPFLKREEAIEADRLINERLSLDGVVMSAN
jgi:cell division septation protein DedD